MGVHPSSEGNQSHGEGSSRPGTQLKEGEARLLRGHLHEIIQRCVAGGGHLPAQRSDDVAGRSGLMIVRPPQLSNEQLFAAVTAELRAAPEATQREACKATVALEIPSERVPQVKKSYIS